MCVCSLSPPPSTLTFPTWIDLAAGKKVEGEVGFAQEGEASGLRVLRTLVFGLLNFNKRFLGTANFGSRGFGASRGVLLSELCACVPAQLRSTTLTHTT